MTPEWEGILSDEEFWQLWLNDADPDDDLRKLLISHASLLNKVKWLESGRG